LFETPGYIHRVERWTGIAAGIAEEHQHAAIGCKGRAFVVESGGENSLARAIRFHDADRELPAALLGEGLQPNALENRLYVDPILPDWLPDLTILGLRVGEGQFDVKFWRDGINTRWDVLKGDVDAIAHRRFSTGRNLS
jgi:hypothetical protein